MQFDKLVSDNSHMLIVRKMPDGKQKFNEFKQFKDEVKFIINENTLRKQQSNALAIRKITIVLTSHFKIPYTSVYHQEVLEEKNFSDIQALAIADLQDKNWYSTHKGLIDTLRKSGIEVHVITNKVLEEHYQDILSSCSAIYEKDLQEDRVMANLRTETANKFANQLRKQHELERSKYPACLNAASIYLDKEILLRHLFTHYGKTENNKITDINGQEILIEPFTFEGYPGPLDDFMNYYREKHGMHSILPLNTINTQPQKQQIFDPIPKKTTSKQKKNDTLGYIALHQVELHVPNSESSFFNIICFPAYALLSCASKNTSIDIATIFILEYFQFLTNFIDKHLKENENQKNRNLYFIQKILCLKLLIQRKQIYIAL